MVHLPWEEFCLFVCFDTVLGTGTGRAAEATTGLITRIRVAVGEQ